MREHHGIGQHRRIMGFARAVLLPDGLTGLELRTEALLQPVEEPMRHDNPHLRLIRDRHRIKT